MNKNKYIKIMIYPDDKLESWHAGNKEERLDPASLVGKTGLTRLMTFEEKYSPPSRNNFVYKNKDERIFAPQNIGKYSGKIKNIIDKI